MTTLKRDQMAEDYVRSPDSDCEVMDTFTAHENTFKAGWDACESEKRAYMHLQTTKEMIEWQAQATALAELLQSLNIQAIVNGQSGQQSITARINGALASFQEFKDGLNKKVAINAIDNKRQAKMIDPKQLQDPGRDLDAFVQRAIFDSETTFAKSPIGRFDWFYKIGEAFVVVPPYSTNIAAAWTVVEKLKDTHYNFQIENDQGELNAWLVQFGAAHSESDSAPHAICLAALKASEHSH